MITSVITRLGITVDVSHCYVFKSRLQEYAQKAGLTTPVYHTIKEGPCHQPLFRSTVVVNNVSYHSLTGFSNHKAAEQSAAEVALAEIAKSGATDGSVSHPVASHCYVFKSRLQEYTQRAGLAPPVYHTINKGPYQQPLFRSTVVVNNVSYHSLTGFLNRKAAEQSAAEVALTEIAKSGTIDKSVSHPVHETGLCKNLLQDYAQKMNYAMPSYVCKKDEKKGNESLFSCTVELGGIKYVGAAAKSKKEAEVKAAKTALITLKMSGSESDQKPNSESEYTVMHMKRKVPDLVFVATEEKVDRKKKKTGRLQKRRKKRFETPGDVLDVKKNDSLDGNEVKDLNLDGNEVKGSNLVPDLVDGKFDKKKRKKDKKRKKRFETAGDVLGVNKDDSFPGEVKAPNSDGNEVKAPNSDGNKVKDPNSDGNEGRLSCGEGVLVSCDNAGEKEQGSKLGFETE